MQKVHIEGISKLEAKDIKYAEELGFRIKLLGITKNTNYGVEVRVHPALVPKSEDFWLMWKEQNERCCR